MKRSGRKQNKASASIRASKNQLKILRQDHIAAWRRDYKRMAIAPDVLACHDRCLPNIASLNDKNVSFLKDRLLMAH